ncbi:MAG: DUF547 domain-containing protein [Flavobacteriia bacterium]|nr:DUF547 domain-containing protein [Flavobacteriia bacterium]
MKLLLLFFLSASISSKAFSQELKYEPWNLLLNQYVSKQGNANYKALKKNTKLLNECTTYFKNHPFSKDWSLNEKKSYWVNLYNFYTIQLIVKHYPLKSIKEIKVENKNAWELPMIPYENKLLTLNELENKIIRKESKDARIHFLLNCASFSCPILLNKAITSKDIEQQLNTACKTFLNDKKRNKISSEQLELSALFSWYKEDFPNLIEFIQEYTEITLNKNAKINYLEYNWNLNE